MLLKFNKLKITAGQYNGILTPLTFCAWSKPGTTPTLSVFAVCALTVTKSSIVLVRASATIPWQQITVASRLCHGLGCDCRAIDLKVDLDTFEFLFVRVVSRSSSCVVACVYRPGSTAVTSVFFTEITDVISRLATFNEPVFIVGDVNIRLERPDDSDAVQLIDYLAAHGFANQVPCKFHTRPRWRPRRCRLSRLPCAAVC